MSYVARGGVRLSYEDNGTGAAVLLYTGGGGDGQMWDLAGYIGALSGYRTIVLDHRGHGRSDCPPGLAAHQLGEYVADVIAVLDDAGVNRAALVGYSAGAQVAYAVARFKGARKRAIIAIAHTLLKIAYAVLKSGRPYEEPGPDFCTRRDSAQARQDYLLRQLQKLNPGCVVTITPAEAA